MKKYLTIDFDIIMHPSIEIYNDYGGTAEEFLSQFNFIKCLPADLELYKELTLFLLENKDKIYFIEEHDSMVPLTKGEGPFELINIDHHHDLGYSDNISWNIPITNFDEGNWVKKLWDLNRITKYTWIKDEESLDPPRLAKKFLTEVHLIDTVNFKKDFSDVEKIYISHSPEWIPYRYDFLYQLWENMFVNQRYNVEELTLQDIEESEQVEFDFSEYI